jgi:hypothetical protein
MTVAYLAPALRLRSYLANGQPNSYGTVATYAGGTNTPIATYTDNTGSFSNLNPVKLGPDGSASVWLTPNTAYKFIEFDQFGNQLDSMDQVLNSQLITYYGVDSGAANAYLLTAATPYTAYANGQLIFFVAGNTNTGPSTLNVNGLGVIPIVTITGAPLGAGQIQAGIMSELIYFNGNFQLLSIGNVFGSTIGTFGSEIPLASAATTDLGTTPNHNVMITGTTTITSFGSSASVAAPLYLIRFTSSLILTYSSALILPGGASIVTQAGDYAFAEYFGSGNWRVAFYQYSQSSASNAKIKPADTARVSNAVLTADPDLQTNTLAVGRYSYELLLIFDSVAAGAGFQWTNDGSAVDSRTLMPGLVVGFVNGAAVGPANSSFYATTITYASVGTGANSNQVLYKGSMLVGTPGTLGISWAQDSSTASATTLRAGSYLNVNLLNTGSSANTVQRVYTTAGPGVETIPTGYNTLTLEVWGGSGAGGSNTAGAGGGGGGTGGYSRSIITVTGLGGDTIDYTVGAAASASSASSGTLAITTMTANGGATGTNAVTNTPGSGGLGGTASGGTAVNTMGNTGGAGTGPAGGSLPGTGAFGIPGIFDGGNKGGNGGLGGLPGIVLFNYA